MTPAPVATARVLEVGCSNGANLLPMAAALPDARFVGCDLSRHAIAEARRGAAELGLANVTLHERDLATLAERVPTNTTTSSRTACTRGCRPTCATRCSRSRRAGSSRNGVLFVSYNVYPGCHVRQAAWEMLHLPRRRDPGSARQARRRPRARGGAGGARRHADETPTRCCGRNCGACPRRRTARSSTTTSPCRTIPCTSTRSPRISRGTDSRSSPRRSCR